MAVGLTLTSPALDDAGVQDLTREFCRLANTEADIKATLSTGPRRVGQRSDGIQLIGQVALTFLSGGAAVALINVFRPLFERHPTLEISIDRKERKLTLKAQDIGSKQITETLARLKRFCNEDE